MPVVCRKMGRLIGVTIVIAVAACRPVWVAETPGSGGQATLAVSATPTLPQAGQVVWGRVPYCNCLGDTATANVAGALQEANLTTSLQELSPRDGWLYFAVSFDPAVATWDQVQAAMLAGGAELLEGPP